QNIYVGIDVHLKSWTVSIQTETLHHKTFTQPADVSVLVNYLREHFPYATYYSVYEAGFSGFWAHYKLGEMDINNIVINPADVPTSQKEQLQKDDPTDSRKLARSLRAGSLTAIHVPSKQTLHERSLVRVRSSLVKDMSRFKQRIKSLLYFYGISYPKEFESSGTHWSKAFIQWLKENVSQDENMSEEALLFILKEVEQQRKLLLEVTRKIRALSRSEKYNSRMALLRTIPGIGFITAITFLTELEDIHRFGNMDQLAGYIGLVPNRHSSGSKENVGEMTFRGQKLLKACLIESAWFAARLDPAMNLCFNQSCKRMEPNKAIIKIARKLVNR
ncbi:hypothetical protein EZS27_038609, partial [termite gut metagenome]